LLCPPSLPSFLPSSLPPSTKITILESSNPSTSNPSSQIYQLQWRKNRCSRPISNPSVRSLRRQKGRKKEGRQAGKQGGRAGNAGAAHTKQKSVLCSCSTTPTSTGSACWFSLSSMTNSLR
jgi:hypothetical protein